jgi:hypothetical protein
VGRAVRQEQKQGADRDTFRLGSSTAKCRLFFNHEFIYTQYTRTSVCVDPANDDDV